MPGDKLLVRVEQAVAAGYATSIEIADHIGGSRHYVNALLGVLCTCGVLTREKRCRGAGHGSGRATFYYRIRQYITSPRP